MNLYLLFKSLHLIAVISWMAGLLYLPRIFVYHVENFEKKQTTEVFEIMEKRLFNYIMKPAMVLSWLLGLILILIIGIETFSFLWLQIKLILVFLLSVYNDYLGKCMRLLKSGENEKSSKFYRRINEIPTVLLIFIVFIVIFKPL
jgi:putative membrane protein